MAKAFAQALKDIKEKNEDKYAFLCKCNMLVYIWIYGFSRLLLKIFSIGTMKMNNKGSKRNVFLSSPPKVNTFSFDMASTMHTNNR